MALGNLADIGIGNDLSVHLDGNMVAFHYDFLGAPLPQRLVLDALGRHYSVNGTVYLIVPQPSCVGGSVVVQNLELAHAVICRIHVLGSTHSDTVVHAFLKEAELETVDEVAVFLVGVEVAGGTVIG